MVRLDLGTTVITSVVVMSAEAPSTPGVEEELVRIERDLADVEIALQRLGAGTYWTCEITGQDLPDALLEQRPAARQVQLPRAFPQ